MTEAQRILKRARDKRYRERRKALGLTPKRTAYMREWMRNRRAQRKAQPHRSASAEMIENSS